MINNNIEIKNNIVCVRIDEDMKNRMNDITDNVSEYIRNLIINDLNNRETKVYKIKRALREKKDKINQKISIIHENEEQIKLENQKAENEIKTLENEINELNQELNKQEVEETPEYTENETLNNLIKNRIIKPFEKSNKKDIIQYLDENFSSIKRLGARYGLKIIYEDLKQLLLSIINNNNNNNNNKYIDKCNTILQIRSNTVLQYPTV